MNGGVLTVGAQSFRYAPNNVTVVDRGKDLMLKGFGKDNGAFCCTTWADTLFAAKSD